MVSFLIGAAGRPRLPGSRADLAKRKLPQQDRPSARRGLDPPGGTLAALHACTAAVRFVPTKPSYQVRDIESTIHGRAKSSSSQPITATIRPCRLSSRWVRSQISRESTASNGFTRSRRFSCSATLQGKSDFPRPARTAASRLSASPTESVALGPLVLAAPIQRACGRWLKPSWYPIHGSRSGDRPLAAYTAYSSRPIRLVNDAPACSGRDRRSAMSASRRTRLTFRPSALSSSRIAGCSATKAGIAGIRDSISDNGHCRHANHARRRSIRARDALFQTL